jgi:predicted aldo/keto reductase-like oxidoreductase
MTEHADPEPDNRPSGQGVTRRGLILGGAAALGVAASARGAAGGVPEAPGPKPVMPTAILGRTGMRVSRLAQGGSWHVDPEVLAVGAELGINYIDTAEGYVDGNSERAVGEYLKDIGATGHSAERQKIWLVSKTFDHAGMEKHLAGTLGRLNQDYIDCYYMHMFQNPDALSRPETRAMAERLKKSGKIRFFGFSTHSATPECLTAAAQCGYVDVIMFRYDHHIFPQAKLDAAIDVCHKAGIGLVAMKVQLGGMTLPDRYNVFKQRGLNQYQAAIKAVAEDERVHSICSEMVNTDQLQLNAVAISSKLSTAERDALHEHGRLISHLWCRGCEHICREASGAGAQIAVFDTLRFLMYHDHYGKREQARKLFADLPAEQRDLRILDTADWRNAETACPFHVPLQRLMARARERLG